jgi:pimeloyl-ACP methyl ester carboxylesterase
MPTIQAHGLEMAYEAWGAGPPLIALHGATGSGSSQMAGLAASFQRSMRSLAPDARGHAGTRWDVSLGLRTTDLVDDVLAFADALGLDTFHLLGYSMGGMTALTLAAQHRARLRSLVLVSIAAEREPRLAVGRALLDPDRIARDDPAWANSLAARHDPIQGEGSWRRLLTAVVDDIASQSLLTPSQLRGIERPTMVVAGDRDPFVPVDRAWQLSRQVRDGRLLIVPGAGHDLLDPRHTLVTPAIAAFYASIDLGPPMEDHT